MIRTFGKKKLVRDISANTAQTGITQVFGLVIFYLTSKYLSKDDFGELNWSMAVGSTIIAVASLGLDLVFVKRIASGADVVVMSGIHFFHTVITGVVLCSVAYGVHFFVNGFTSLHPLFFFVFLNLALSNVANSFKLCLNGLESYRRLAILAFISNSIKLGVILVIYIRGNFSLFNVIMAYTLASAIEFVLGYYMMSLSITARVKPLLKVLEYKYFILESLPQLGVVLFDSALARIDWILLGVISTATVTAEYSFVYKVFELSKLPLLIVAPILLTRFSKIYAANVENSEMHHKNIGTFFKLELFVMMIIPIILVCMWTPLVDYFTDGKYGLVNESKYWLLACCVPMVTVINFLWTLAFVQGQLRSILFITVAVSVLNIIANAILIPMYAGMGSCLAFVICTIIQLFLYIIFVRQNHFKPDYLSCVIMFASGCVAVAFAKFTTNNVIFTMVMAVALHFILALITGQVSVARLRQVIAGK